MINPEIQTPQQQAGFDAMTYFNALTRQNRLCQEKGFKPVMASSPMSLEGLLQEMKTTARFVAIDDTNEGSVFENSGGYFKNTTFTVWILSRYKFGDMNDRQEQLNLCRNVYRQFLARILHDKYQWSLDFTYLLNDQVETRELGAWFIDGLTGVEFHLTIQEQLSLTYDDTLWQE